MAEQIEETRERVVQDGDRVETARRVTTNVGDGLDTADVVVEKEESRNTIARAVYYIAGVLTALLAFRFVLSLLGANRGNAFADLIYSVTYPFVAPFFGLFGYEVQYGVARFEIETLVAMLVYWLLAVAIVKLLNIPSRTRAR